MEKITVDLQYPDDIRKEINRFKDAAQEPEALMLWIVATHTDRPINNRIYKREEVLKALKTWTEPYKCPVLVHHDGHSDAVGRVVEALYIPKEEWDKVQELTGRAVPLPEDSTGAVLLKVVVTDKDAVHKVLTMRYHTVSIGFDAKHMHCSICGADWSEKPCKHEPGKSYDGQTMYLIPEGIRYLEVSFVNVPADDHAMVVAFKEISLEDVKKLVGGETGVPERETTNPTDTQQQMFSDNMTKDESQAGVPGTEDNKSSETCSQREVSEMDDRKLIDELQNENAKLKAQLDELQEKLEKVKSEKEQLEEVVKQDLLEKVIALKMMLAAVTGNDVDGDELKAEYEKLSVSELKVLARELDEMLDVFEFEDMDEADEEEDETDETEEEDDSEEPEIKRVGPDTEKKDAKNEDEHIVNSILKEIFDL